MSDHWQPCSTGTLAEYSARSKRAGARRRWVLAGTSVVATSFLLLAGFVAWPRSQPGRIGTHGGLACPEVLGLVDNYLTGAMATEQREQVGQHLDHCPGCRRVYETRAAERGIDMAKVLRRAANGLLLSVLPLSPKAPGPR